MSELLSPFRQFAYWTVAVGVAMAGIPGLAAAQPSLGGAESFAVLSGVSVTVAGASLFLRRCRRGRRRHGGRRDAGHAGAGQRPSRGRCRGRAGPPRCGHGLLLRGESDLHRAEQLDRSDPGGGAGRIVGARRLLLHWRRPADRHPDPHWPGPVDLPGGRCADGRRWCVGGDAWRHRRLQGHGRLLASRRQCVGDGPHDFDIRRRGDVRGKRSGPWRPDALG